MPEPSRPVVVVVACALIDDAGRVLIAKRPEGRPLAGLWEFPGGKLEPGEAPEQGLKRELAEELGITLMEERPMPLTFVSHAYPDFHLLMPVFACRDWQGKIAGREGQEFRFVRPEELEAYAMPPADEPLKRNLARFLRSLPQQG